MGPMGLFRVGPMELFHVEPMGLFRERSMEACDVEYPQLEPLDDFMMHASP